MNHQPYDEYPSLHTHAHDVAVKQPSPAHHGSAPDDDPATATGAVPTGFGKSTRFGVTLFAVALAAALCVIFFRGQHARSKAAAELKDEVVRAADAPVAVDVVHVKTAASASSLLLPGEARAFNQTTIFARTSGYISKWLVDFGDQVKENQVLALIETPELDDQLHAAQAKLESLNSEVGVAETDVKFAQVSFDRWDKLSPGGAVSKQERDQKAAELDSSKAKLQAAKAQVKLGQAEVERLQTLESFKQVKAPFAGVITQRHIDIGSLVTAGSTSSTTPLFSIAKSDPMRVWVDVPQVAVPLMNIGMTVNATCREYPGQKFTGKLDRTADAIDQTSKTLRVEVLVPNKDMKLKTGMYMMVDFESTRAHPPMEVPAGALVFRPTGPQIAVVTPDGKVEMRPVTITRDTGENVEIQAAGIDTRTEVALNVGNDVETGDRVEAHDVDAPATADTQPPQPAPAKPQASRTAEANAARPM
jgi:RND family efflux transporter MFP subunit